MPREQLPAGADADQDWKPSPKVPQYDMGRLACIEYLKLSGEAQVKDPPVPDPWRPAALGMWADALEDTDDAQFFWTVEAMRYVQRHGHRPYCCTEQYDRWSWFDVSKKIEEMEDSGSDLAPWLFALLKCGKLEVNFRIYPTAIEAVEDVIASLADWFRSGRRLDERDEPVPLKEEEKPAADPPLPDSDAEADGPETV